MGRQINDHQRRVHLGDFLQRWSGVGTFAIAAIAILGYLATRTDDAVNAYDAGISHALGQINERLLGISGQLTNITDTLVRMDERDRALGERVASLEATVVGVQQKVTTLETTMVEVSSKLSHAVFRLDLANDRLRQAETAEDGD